MKIRKPIIGIVARPDTNKTLRSCMQALEQYRRAIVRNGGNPIIILPTQNLIYETANLKDVPELSEEEENDLIEQINLCDGLLLPGGDRIFYYDLFIAKYALEHDIPLLGICMGMQIMGIVDNDDFSCLIDVKDKLMHKKDYQGNCYHTITINEKSKLFEIIKERELEVNSIHSKVLSHVTTAKITAFSKEEEIEAIEFDLKKFAIGVQWHPELMLDNSNEKLFKRFIESSK